MMKPKVFRKGYLIALAGGIFSLALTVPFLSTANATINNGEFSVKSVDSKDPAIWGTAGMAGTDGSSGENPEGPGTPEGSGTMVFSIDTAALNCNYPSIHVQGVSSDAVLIAPDGTESKLLEGVNQTPTTGEWKIEGTFTGFGTLTSGTTAHKNCLVSVDRWENTGTVDISRAFMHAQNLTYVAEPPSTVENMNLLFSRSSFDSDISSWDVSGVKSMDGIFYQAGFSQNLSSWKACLIATEPTSFARFAPIENDKAKHPQWGSCS